MTHRGTHMGNTCVQTIYRCVEHSYQVQWPTADTAESQI